MMNTGSQQFGRPSMGAWVTYGLGSESPDLPGFVVFSSGNKGPAAAIPAGAAAFCPRFIRASCSAAAAIRCCICPIPRGVDEQCSAIRSTRLRRLNQMRLEATGDPEIATRINSFEMAFRMQTSAPELMDLSKEPKADPGHVRRRARQAVVCEQLPAGSPAGRTRRALRATLPRSVGPARQSRQRYQARIARTPIRRVRRWSRI